MPTTGLICPYLDQDPKYALGVEFGIIWMRMRDDNEDVIQEYFTTANQDQILLACPRLGWRCVEMKRWDEFWTWYHLERVAR